MYLVAGIVIASRKGSDEIQEFRTDGRESEIVFATQTCFEIV